MGRGAWTESSRVVREPRITALPCGPQSQVLWLCVVSGLSLGNHLACAHIWSDSAYFLVVRATSQPRWIPARISGGWWDIWIGFSTLLWAPPEFSWLVLSGSTFFLTGTSCCQTTHVSFNHWFPSIISCSLELFLNLSCSLMALTLSRS